MLSVASLALFIVTGCGESRGPLVVTNPDPAVKIPAIQKDVREKTTKDIAQMVQDLDNDDPAVRLYSIQGLKRLTGETFGYEHYFNEDQRKPALRRWAKWLEEHHPKSVERLRQGK